jgi:hypothetical protein
VFLDVLPEMLPTAVEWMKLLAIRQLNHEEARLLLFESGRLARRPNRAALIALLNDITFERGSEPTDALGTRAEQTLAAVGEPT